MFAKLTKNFEEQSTAVILMIATFMKLKGIKLKGDKNNDTTGEENP
jgi:hypothetical protein